jgi:predicted deacylase
LDSKDIDSVFPGDERGTITDRTAREIWRRAANADYVIHLATSWNSCVSHVVCMHREYIHVRNMASQLALPLVVQSPPARGALSIELAHEGIPAVTIELRGGRDQVEPQAAVEVREAILNFLRIKDMLPGERIEASPTFTAKLHHVNVEHEGFFVPAVNVGQVLARGDVIGHVQERKEVASPYDGAAVALSSMNYVFEGDAIAMIAPPLLDQWTKGEKQDDTPPQVRRKW